MALPQPTGGSIGGGSRLSGPLNRGDAVDPLSSLAHGGAPPADHAPASMMKSPSVRDPPKTDQVTGHTETGGRAAVNPACGMCAR